MVDAPIAPQPARPRSRIFLAIAGLIIVLALAGGVYLAAERYQSLETRIAGVEAELRDMGKLETRIDKLEAHEAPRVDLAPIETRLAALEARGDASALAERAAAEGQRLNAQVTGLDARLAALETKGPSAALEARIAQLENAAKTAPRLEALESEHAAALALLMLNAAIERGAPYAAELAAFRRIMKDETALADLSQAAADGIPRRDELISGFEETARAIEAAREADEAPLNFWQRLIGHARGLIVIRQTAPLPGDDAFAIVSRAENDLGKGRIEAAAGEIENLRGGAAEAAAPWLNGAKLRLKADGELLALAARLNAAAGSRP